MDALRTEPGTKFKLAVGDDVPTYKMEPDEIKAFGDPGEEDAWLWARWNGVSLDQSQHRELCTNPYDKDSAWMLGRAASELLQISSCIVSCLNAV